MLAFLASSVVALVVLAALRNQRKAVKNTTIAQRTQKKNMKKIVFNLYLLFIAVN